MQAEINAAVEWWKKALAGFVWQDNGDPVHMAIATWVRERQPKPTAEQIEEFGSALAAILAEIFRKDGSWEKAKKDPHWGSATDGRCLSVDYGPDRVLSAAAQAANIHHGTTLFPVKTVMHVNPGRVTVREGYSGTDVIVYEAAKSP